MTLRELLQETQRRLLPVSGEDAAAEARELVSFALGRRVGFRDGEAVLTEEQSSRLEAAVARRLSHEPLQYVIGEWDLMGLTFSVSPEVLIPRQDTETLVIEAERLIAERGYKTLLDICTGSGCVGISLAKRTGVRTAISDISAGALAVAARNAQALGADCEIVRSDLFGAFTGRRFDIITANPPYIPTETVKTLSEEVRREPVLALDGGADGLDIYRRIARELPAYLAPGGAFAAEIGCDQGERVTELFSPLGSVRLTKDYGGRDRVVTVILDKKC